MPTPIPQHEAARRARSPAKSASTRSAFRSRVSPLMKIVPRGDTTVVDAYLNPVLRTYVERLARVAARQRRAAADLGRRPGRARRASPARTASSPARPAAWSASRASPRRPASRKAIGFDMGGTSTDVSRFDGRFEFEYETREGRRAARRADAGDRNRRGRRRLDLPLRRREARRRPGQRRRRSRPGLLRPRRAADRHRLQLSTWAGFCPSSFRFRSIARRSKRGWPKSPMPCEPAFRNATERRSLRRRRAGRRLRPRSPTPTWPRRSAASRSPRATTRATTCSSPSARPGRSMPAPWRASWDRQVLIHPDAGVLSAWASAWPTSCGTGPPACIERLSRDSFANCTGHVRRTGSRRPAHEVAAGRRCGRRIDVRPARSTCAIGAWMRR